MQPNFLTPWSTNESLRVFAVNKIRNETGFIDVYLNSAGNQIIQQLVLQQGDHVGPITYDTALGGANSSEPVVQGQTISLSAIIDDSLSGTSSIHEAEYFVDVDPGTGCGMPVNPVDGVYDSPMEQVTASINTMSWAEDRTYSIFVRGRDAGNNWGTTHKAVISVIGVPYQFIGFLPPIMNDGTKSFKLGSAVPVKFQLKDGNGNSVYDITATLHLQKYVLDVPVGPPIEAAAEGSSNVGSVFRYDPEKDQYIYNLNTKGLSIGKWKLIVTLNQSGTHEVFVNFK